MKKGTRVKTKNPVGTMGGEERYVTGIVDRVYLTTFGSRKEDWGASVIIDGGHPLNGRKRSTYRLSNIEIIE